MLNATANLLQVPDDFLFQSFSGAVAFNPLTPHVVRTKMIPGSFSRAWSLGHAVLSARAGKACPLGAVLKAVPGSTLVVTGKVTKLTKIIK